MAYPIYVKEKARQLREKKKLTIDELEPSAIRFQRKSNSGELAGRSWRSRYGVLQVRTADTYLRARLEAWMDGVRGEWP